MLPSENCTGGLLIFGEFTSSVEKTLVGLENKLEEEKVWLHWPPKQL